MVHVTVSMPGLLVGQYNSTVSGSVYKRPENELSKAKFSALDFCLMLGELLLLTVCCITVASLSSFWSVFFFGMECLLPGCF